MFHVIKALLTKLSDIWFSLNGDVAYQRYLDHWQAHHAQHDSQPLSRQAFFAAETRRKWSGVKRCC